MSRLAIQEGRSTKCLPSLSSATRPSLRANLRELSRPSGRAGLIFSNRIPWISERLDDDRQLLRQHYLKHGFADVRIVSAQGDLQADSKGYGVHYEIDEGDRFSFGDMRVETSVKTVDAESLQSLVLAETGEAYDAEKIDRTTEAMTFALWEKGDRFARIKPHLDRDATQRRISVTFRVEEFDHLTVERIEVLGNSKTREYVIRREMTLSEGEPFNAFILERDRTRIKALGFFKSVDVEVKKAPAQTRSKSPCGWLRTIRQSFRSAEATLRAKVSSATYRSRSTIFLAPVATPRSNSPAALRNSMPKSASANRTFSAPTQ